MADVKVQSDTSNMFLSRREIVCVFEGMSGRLGKVNAVEAVAEKLNLKDRLVIPMRLKNQVGRTDVIGTFYVYEDEALARKHINPDVMKRFEKAKGGSE